MSKKVIVTHKDLDGVGCAVLFKTIFPDSEVYFEDYKTVNERVKVLIENNSIDTFYITDISVNDDVASILKNAAKEMTLCLIDHHKSAIPLKKYDFVQVNLESCGTSLVFDHFIETYNYGCFSEEKLSQLRQYIDMVRIINDYDLWTHHYPESKDFNTLLGVIGLENMLDRFLVNPSITLSSVEESLIHFENKKKQEYIEKTEFEEVIDRFGRRAAICFAEKYVSELCHHILENYKFDYVVNVNLRSKTVNLRSKKDIDVSTIAIANGGGGHKNAAGYQLKEESIEELIMKLFPYVPAIE